MAGDDNNDLQGTPVCPNPNPNPKPDNNIAPIDRGDLSGTSPSPEDFIRSVALKLASQPLQYSEPDVWGVLTAISDKARRRLQEMLHTEKRFDIETEGLNLLLTNDEHVIGRSVPDKRFELMSNQISSRHCKIYKKKVATEDSGGQSRLISCGFFKDTSTNGTYLNWKKYNKNSPECKLHHGDILSFAAPPQHELAYAYVFREVLISNSESDSTPLKRKADGFGSESKRQRGIGIGASEGPISLDDFRSLQRSNTELRKQLEDQVATIDQLRNEHREAVDLHEVEKKKLKESISNSYQDELKEMRNLIEEKQKELTEVNKITSEQKSAMVDLNERLNSSVQSCTEANEIMRSQNASISELKILLDEERDQRKEDREKADANLTASIQRLKAESQQELNRLSDASSRRENEQQEIINKLQESEKERCSLVETLRSKLEDTREKLVGSDNKVRQLESHLSQEQRVSSLAKKKVQDLENETSRLRKELESEKAAREEAWAKVSALELEINSAMRDLEYQKRRLKAARERIMLRETQLRSFYSTTEQISLLFAKQQEQLKSMQRTLEDEENYDNISLDINDHIDPLDHQNKQPSATHGSGGGSKAADYTTSTKKPDKPETSSDSVTERHECGVRIQETCEETQEAEFGHFDPPGGSKGGGGGGGGFGSDIEGVNTAPIGTETQNIDLNMMAIDDETERVKTDHRDVVEVEEDTEVGDTIKTGDLLASEVAGSWAVDTVPSCHIENESRGSGGDDDGGDGGGGGGGGGLRDSASVVAESQTGGGGGGGGRNHEHEAITKMIGIVAPEMKGEFGGDSEKEVASNSDTDDDCTDDEGSQSQPLDDNNHHKTLQQMDVDDDDDDDDDEATQQDSG
ncbi:hypothetical protein LXL04_022725 [Taraxacum kok-saghyz]